jgi:hypothetical protein
MLKYIVSMYKGDTRKPTENCWKIEGRRDKDKREH